MRSLISPHRSGYNHNRHLAEDRTMDTFGKRYGKIQEKGLKIQDTLDGQVTKLYYYW